MQFKQSVEHRGVFFKSWAGWARALMAQAHSAPPAERPALLKEALEKSREALKVVHLPCQVASVADTQVQAFPSFVQGKLLEGEILLALCEALPREDNSQRWQRALALGEELTVLLPNKHTVWHVLATAAFRLSEPTQDAALLRRAAVAYRKELQFLFDLPEEFTWKEALLSADVNVRSAAVQVRRSRAF